MISGVHNKPWIERAKAIHKVTLPLITQMEKDGVWELTRAPTLEEDKNGVDFFVKIKNLKGYTSKSEIPIQFKVRSSPKFRDLIVARYQPCYGMDQEIFSRSQSGVSEQTADGRDWFGLMNNASVLYFVATMNEYQEFDEISYITSKELKKHVIDIDQQWETIEGEGKMQPKKYYSCKRVAAMLKRNSYKETFCTFHNKDNHQVWYQKNFKESPKFLIYVDKDKRSGFCKIDPIQFTQTQQQLKVEGLI